MYSQNLVLVTITMILRNIQQSELTMYPKKKGYYNTYEYPPDASTPYLVMGTWILLVLVLYISSYMIPRNHFSPPRLSPSFLYTGKIPACIRTQVRYVSCAEGGRVLRWLYRERGWDYKTPSCRLRHTGPTEKAMRAGKQTVRTTPEERVMGTRTHKTGRDR